VIRITLVMRCTKEQGYHSSCITLSLTCITTKPTQQWHAFKGGGYIQTNGAVLHRLSATLFLCFSCMGYAPSLAFSMTHHRVVIDIHTDSCIRLDTKLLSLPLLLHLPIRGDFKGDDWNRSIQTITASLPRSYKHDAELVL
jgi:hypothetical protein